MATNVIEIPAKLVKAGDVVFHNNKEYLIVNILRLSGIIQLQHYGGYFNFEWDQAVQIFDRPPALETSVISFNNQIKPVFLPWEEAVEPFSDEEDVKGADVEVGDDIWYKGNWATVTNAYKHPNSPYNKVSINFGDVEGLQIRLTLTGTYSRKVRAVMETLNIQNAIEAQRILLQKLEQMLDLTQLVPLEGDKVLVGGSSVRVDKATVVKAARDEMKVAASKSAELIKKL